MNWDDSDGFCMSAHLLTRPRLREPSLSVHTDGCTLAASGESPKETQNGGVGGVDFWDPKIDFGGPKISKNIEIQIAFKLCVCSEQCSGRA